MNDPRIGTLNADGSVQTHPSVNVLGKPYDRPAAITQGIGVGFFVVLPLSGDVTAALADVTGIVSAVEAPKRKAKAVDDSSD